MTKVEAEQEFTELPENEKLNWLNATVWTKEQLSQRPDLIDSGFEYRYVNYLTLGNPCSSTMCLTDYVHQVKERLSRWNEGLYTGLEAVKILTESNPAINPSSLKKQIIEAVESCSLVVRENGIPVNVKLGDATARALVMPIRLVDINAWLKNNQAGYVLVHPYDAAVAHFANQASPSLPIREHDTQPQEGKVETSPVVDERVSIGLGAGNAGKGWSLKPSIQRTPGYRWPLYEFLRTAHTAGQFCPKAQHVLDAWKLAPPCGLSVIQLPTRDELEYELETGKKKRANVKGIQAVIKDLLAE